MINSRPNIDLSMSTVNEHHPIVFRCRLDADSMQRALVTGLQSRGVDAIRSFEAGMAGASDEEQLEFATARGRVLFSYNASDFQRIHTQCLSHGKSHAGIILAPQQRYSVGGQVTLLLNLMAARSSEQLRDHLEFISNWA